MTKPVEERRTDDGIPANVTINVHVFELSPKLLARMPHDERVFFLMLGHIANELNTLRKLVLIGDRHSFKDLYL